MHCYCFNEFTVDIAGFYDIEFNDVAMNVGNSTDQPAYCKEWL